MSGPQQPKTTLDNKVASKQEHEATPSAPSHQAKPSKTRVLGPADMRLPNPKPEAVVPEKPKKAGKAETVKAKELTLQEKIEAMELATKKKNKERQPEEMDIDSASQDPPDVTPRAESLQAVLVQVILRLKRVALSVGLPDLFSSKGSSHK